MPPSRPVCIYVTGDPPESIRAAHGDYATWFARVFERQGATCEVVDGRGDGGPPDPRRFAGIAITGSAASLTAPEPWMEAGVELVREAARTGTPVLGICFGHQLIAACFGAQVIQNPAGWELSTHDVELTPAGEADPLFSGLPRTFAVNSSHRDAIAEDTLATGNGARILARSSRAIQAIAGWDSIRGVQFHPEFSGEVTRRYVELRGGEMAEPVRADLRERARDCPAGEQVLANWIEHFVDRA